MICGIVEVDRLFSIDDIWENRKLQLPILKGHPAEVYKQQKLNHFDIFGVLLESKNEMNFMAQKVNI